MTSHQGSTTGPGTGGGATASPRHPPLGGATTGLAGASAEPLLLGPATSSSGLGPSLVVGGTSAVGGALGSDTDLDPILMDLAERKEECQRLAEEIESLKVGRLLPFITLFLEFIMT